MGIGFKNKLKRFDFFDKYPQYKEWNGDESRMEEECGEQVYRDFVHNCIYLRKHLPTHFVVSDERFVYDEDGTKYHVHEYSFGDWLNTAIARCYFW
jgi:hypothetical protein